MTGAGVMRYWERYYTDVDEWPEYLQVSIASLAGAPALLYTSESYPRLSASILFADPCISIWIVILYANPRDANVYMPGQESSMGSHEHQVYL